MIPSESSHPQEMDSLRWSPHPGMFRPDYGRCLAGVFPTIFDLLGHPVEGYAGLSDCLPPAAPREARRVLLVCVDAFGFKELEQSRRFRALYPQYGTWITSVFPTITSCALSSLYQALPPARHGITGHVIWKDFPGALVDMLRMQVIGADASLQDSGFDVHRWKREPGFLDGMPGAESGSSSGDGSGVGSGSGAGPGRGDDGLAGYQLLHRHILGSGLSSLIYGKTPLVGYYHSLEGIAKAARILSEMERGWVGLYLDEVDVLSHVLTGDSPLVGTAARRIEENLLWLAAELPPAVAESTVVMVVADHGQSNIREKIPLYGQPYYWLEKHTRAVGNSGRVLHVYLEDGQERRVRAWLEETTGARGRVFPFDEIKALTGPPLEEGGSPDPGQEAWVRRSMGDLVAVLDDGYNWEKRDPRKSGGPYGSQLVSQHGGLSWNEMFVPFLCAPLLALLEE